MVEPFESSVKNKQMICPDNLISEAIIQAEFYHACRLIGLPCLLELTTPAGRLDAVVVSSDFKRMLAIVECKHNEHGKVFFSRQIKRYKALGVPVYGLAKVERASRLAEQLLRTYSIYDPNVGKEIDSVLAMKRIPRRKSEFSNPDYAMTLCEEVNFK